MIRWGYIWWILMMTVESSAKSNFLSIKNLTHLFPYHVALNQKSTLLVWQKNGQSFGSVVPPAWDPAIRQGILQHFGTLDAASKALLGFQRHQQVLGRWAHLDIIGLGFGWWTQTWGALLLLPNNQDCHSNVGLQTKKVWYVAFTFTEIANLHLGHRFFKKC